jgi:hypothetical protein
MAAATFAADPGLEAELIDQQPTSTQYWEAARTSPARGKGISCHNPDLIWLPVSDRRCPERPRSADSVEKLALHFSCNDFGGLKPSPSRFASL